MPAYLLRILSCDRLDEQQIANIRSLIADAMDRPVEQYKNYFDKSAHVGKIRVGCLEIDTTDEDYICRIRTSKHHYTRIIVNRVFEEELREPRSGHKK